MCAAILERLVTRYQLDAESAGKFGSRTLLTSYGCGPQFLAGGRANISGFKDLGKTIHEWVGLGDAEGLVATKSNIINYASRTVEFNEMCNCRTFSSRKMLQGKFLI